MVGRIMAPKDVPGICEYVTFSGKRYTMCRITAMALKTARLSWISQVG